MFYTISFYVSLIIFGLGLLYRLYVWLSRNIGRKSGNIPFSKRIYSAISGILSTLFSPKIIILLKVFILDVLFQRKILKEDFLRWLMHILIFWGFMLLLLMHALDSLITTNIFSNYYSTLNPFMFLRDIFGLFVIIGILIAIFRRFILKVPRLSSNSMDLYLIIILMIIIISGVLLEAVKISSYSIYQDMVDEYSSTDNIEELKSLEAYWVNEFALVSDKEIHIDSAILDNGKKIHNESCADCHSNPRWAFTGYAAASIIKPIARGIDKANMPRILLYIHFIAVFLAMAYLPFSKMLHIIASPISLMANSVMNKEISNTANIATRQIIELDACTHCGTCSLRCSLLAAYEMLDNSSILPSEKMIHIKALINGKKLNEVELTSLLEGVCICSNCDRCTVVCPSGINLKDLWYAVREELIGSGYSLPFLLSPFSFSRGLMKEEFNKKEYLEPLKKAKYELTSRLDKIKDSQMVLSVSGLNKGFLDELKISTDAGTFSYCFSCSTCSASCPVVQNYKNPMDVLGLLPHQIIHAAALGQRDIAVVSSMLWDCLTCYKCQEACPQGVRVTEVMYKLKNLSTKSNHKSMKKTETLKSA